MMPTKGQMPMDSDMQSAMGMQEEQPDSPPNLREQEQAGQNCKNCVHYDLDERKCQKYDTDTQPFQVCDSYSDNPDDAMPEQEADEE